MNIHIKMAKQPFMLNVTMTVFLNGKESAWLESGDETELAAMTGENTIICKGSVRKKKIHFWANDDVSITLRWNRLWGNIEALVTGSNVRILK